MRKSLKINYAFVLIIFITNGVMIAQTVIKSMKKLPDTGQSTSYTNTPGEDSDYSINLPFYLNNGNGTITDTVTGLMWQQVDGGEMTQESAVSYANNLVLGGLSDWRLPTVLELHSILNHDKNNPALNTVYFTSPTAQYWWGSQLQMNDASKAWVTNSGGGVGNHPKSETISAGGSKRFHVRAVRDITSPPVLTTRFIDNKNGTTTDQLTGLIWQQIPTDSMIWEQALLAAEALVLGGSNAWRMPNIKELQSISEVSIFNPSISKTYFSGITTSLYWSSTSLSNQNTRAWYLDSQYGITSQVVKTNKLRLLAVRSPSTVTAVTNIENIKADFKIFPNPGNGQITIQSENELGEIEIINILGQTILKTKTKERSVHLFLEQKGLFQVIHFYGNKRSSQSLQIH